MAESTITPDFQDKILALMDAALVVIESIEIRPHPHNDFDDVVTMVTIADHGDQVVFSLHRGSDLDIPNVSLRTSVLTEGE